MVANINNPWMPQPVQYNTPQVPQREPNAALEIGTDLAAKGAGVVADKTATAGVNALAGQAGTLGKIGSFLGGTAPAATGAATGAGTAAAGGAASGLAGAGLAAGAAAAAPWVLGGAALGKAFGLFQDGTMSVPEMSYGPDPLMMAGGGFVPKRGYQEGVDSVPAMLTPEEAVIPAPAAQDPMNKPVIEGMVEQGRAMNDGMPAQSPMAPMGLEASEPSESMLIAGPLSGKAQREEMKLLQDMSLKKKSWMADEKRKEEAHQQKMKMDKMKGALAMKQSQE